MPRSAPGSALSERDRIRLALDLAYGPDPHNLKVADTIMARIVSVLSADPSHDVQAAVNRLTGGESS